VGLDGPGPITSKARFFSSPQPPRPTLGPIQPPVQRVPGTLSPRVKRQARDANHTLLSKAEVKNGEAIPPLPQMSLLYLSSLCYIIIHHMMQPPSLRHHNKNSSSFFTCFGSLNHNQAFDLFTYTCIDLLVFIHWPMFTYSNTGF
jgi:hypothetical protein